MRIHKQLRQWCDENSLEFLAYRCEVTAGYIHKLIAGERVPSKKLARRMQRVTKGKIAFKAWERAWKQHEKQK